MAVQEHELHEVHPVPAESKSKPERAYDFLRTRITSGAFAPNQRILPGPIAAELGFSIVPVREAIQRLTAEGFLVIEHNVGARLAAFDAEAYRQGMESLAMLDGMATMLAAAHLGPKELKVARAINQRMRAALDDFEATSYSVLNAQFHEALFSRCPNQRILELVRTEWARFANLRDPAHILDADRARESVAEHEHLVHLIETGAPVSEIEAASREHSLTTLRAQLGELGLSQAGADS